MPTFIFTVLVTGVVPVDPLAVNIKVVSFSKMVEEISKVARDSVGTVVVIVPVTIDVTFFTVAVNLTTPPYPTESTELIANSGAGITGGGVGVGGVTSFEPQPLNSTIEIMIK